MTSRISLVERAVERFNSGDYAGFGEIFAPDVVLAADPQVADRSEYHGRAGIQTWIAEALGRWDGVRFAALGVEQVGDAVLVELAVVGETGAVGGGAWRLYVLLLWDGDQANRVRAYPNRALAVADAKTEHVA
ncbi:MAG: SnoaL-like domain [Solirubrobacterales bacterium]|nr:SnoaL-like domain [Solirubrobacterales bacterium]